MALSSTAINRHPDRIVVIDGPRRAWTNPIWVDAFI